VRLCLWEKDLSFEVTEIHFWQGDHLTPEYLALNPNGVVPTLLHDGTPVIDSSVIVEYLDEVFPELRMSPTDAMGRARMRAWMRFLEEVPTTAIRVPSFNKVFVQMWQDKSDADLTAQANARPLRKGMYREMGREGFNAEKYDDSIERLSMTIARMDKALAENEWLCGDTIMLPDVCVIPTIDRMEDIGLQHLWEGAPNVQRWWAAVKRRPSYDKTYYEGSRVSTRFEIQP
jgi:glutathione S-transferase